ncbi:uncharacterized protein [Palaemon carinicauda]|uniref:uncharacterized protein n=1 Tax=Palaemon carinicauda TaxID=392227 RepID=UPI0035B59323
MKEASKDLKQVAGVTFRKADKTTAFVLIDTEEYHKKLDDILADSSKFVRLTRNPIEDIKREANRTIEAVNAATNAIHLPVISGDFWPGYLYGNEKTHKQGNPLRPIISQCPTPTYQLAKQLNAILTPYIPNRYCVTSSAEFLEKIKNSTCDGVIASMAVESLFTNVPVDETIDLIADRVYRDDSTPTLNIPKPALGTLLAICSKRAPFTTHRGHTYLQKDGVAMGSPLGVLFANFYMGVVEERVFSRVESPFLYFRYIYDTFVKARSRDEIETLRRTFEDHSVLRFTLEHSQDNHLLFLDVLVTSTENRFRTTMYTKPTNLGMCLNGDSECPTRYKSSTIKAYVRRALSHSSTWCDTHKELDQISQVLVNNGFSNKHVQKEVRKAVDKWYEPAPAERPDTHIVSNTKIIGSAPDSRRLRILEALLIQRDKPTLNTTQEMFLLPSSRCIDTSRNPHQGGPNEDTTNHENTPNFDDGVRNNLGHVGQFAERESSLTGSELTSANQNSGPLMTSQTVPALIKVFVHDIVWKYAINSITTFVSRAEISMMFSLPLRHGRTILVSAS